METTTLIIALTPFVVYLVTKLVSWILPKIPAILITTLVVPAISAVGIWIASLLGGTNPWYLQLILGFTAVFIHEFIKNIQQSSIPLTLLVIFVAVMMIYF
jgi:hypothetical protein